MIQAGFRHVVGRRGGAVLPREKGCGLSPFRQRCSASPFTAVVLMFAFAETGTLRSLIANGMEHRTGVRLRSSASHQAGGPFRLVLTSIAVMRAASQTTSSMASSALNTRPPTHLRRGLRSLPAGFVAGDRFQSPVQRTKLLPLLNAAKWIVMLFAWLQVVVPERVFLPKRPVHMVLVRELEHSPTQSGGAKVI